MEFRVSINGTILKNNPKGLNTFSKEFTLDSDIFGIYSVSSFDLVFVGDGYCILKDFFDLETTCDIFIKIEQYCNKSWKTIFDGIAEVGSIKINEANSEANIEIQDNSPLVLISRNSDVTIDLETNKDIFDNTITPAIFSSFSYGTPKNNSAYSGYGVYWTDALRLVTEAITGVNVSITSNYLSTNSQYCIYTIQYVGNLADITDSTIEFKNFQGNTQTVTANFQVGNPHLVEMSKRLLSSSVYLNNNGGISRAMQYNEDYRNFVYTEVDAPTKTITCYSNLPIEIISASANGFSPITITVTKTQDFVDGGNNPVFFNYRSIKNQPSPYLFNMTFKQIMENLNKEYNVYFTAKYNNAGDIELVVEDAGYFFDVIPNFTFETPKDIEMEYSETLGYSGVTLGDDSNTTLANRNFNLSTDVCAIKNIYDSKSSFNIGSVKIWEDLANSYQDGLEDVVYLIDNNGAMSYIELTDDLYGTLSLGKITGYVYNLFQTNWHKLYRHFYKFKGDIIGVIPYYDFDTNNYNVRVTNTAPKRFYRSLKFKTTISNDTFGTLTDNIIDFCKVKTQNGRYLEGVISSVTYNYNTGEAEFTILGDNKYVSN